MLPLSAGRQTCLVELPVKSRLALASYAMASHDNSIVDPVVAKSPNAIVEAGTFFIDHPFSKHMLVGTIAETMVKTSDKYC